MAEKERLRAELLRQRDRIEGPDFREALKAARLLRRAHEEGPAELAEEIRALEEALERRFHHPAWRGAVRPPAREDLEARVREWARQEVLAWMKEMERALHERLQTLAETDVRIIRELRSLQERRVPPGGPGAN